jgi:hypothetical protein
MVAAKTSGQKDTYNVLIGDSMLLSSEAELS